MTTGADDARLLLLLNEQNEGDHDDARRALQVLEVERRLATAVVIPFPARLRSGRRQRDVADEIVGVATSLQPTLVLWSHASELDMPPSAIRAIASLASRPALGHYDGDLYHRWYKPLPRTLRRLLPHCDVVFVPGRLSILPGLRRLGCSDIRYVPGWTDEVRFASPLPTERSPELDVVMIGNRIRSDIPGRTMPGARARVRLVRELADAFGDRFAVYGHDWDSPPGRGPAPFAEQVRIYRNARVAVGTNNLDAPYSFSDRLPIALSSGVPLVHSRIEGAEVVFGSDAPFRSFDDEHEAVALVRDLLERPQSELDAMGSSASRLSFARFTITQAYRYMVAVLDAVRQNKLGRPGPQPQNPWLPFEEL